MGQTPPPFLAMPGFSLLLLPKPLPYGDDGDVNDYATGEGALPEPDRGRVEGVAQPRQPQPWHPCQQRHPQDCQQNMP